MDRKQFLFSCSGGLAAVCMQGCAKAYYATSTTSGKQLKVAFSEFSTTDKSGNIVFRSFVLVREERLNFPVVIYRVDEKTYKALYTECTHRGCELNAAPNGLQCPCHGSEFSKDGKVLSPPAESDLITFPVSIEKDFITIEIPKA